MTDLRRTPVPGIFRGLRMFVFAYSISLTLCAFLGRPGVIEAYFLPMLLLSVCFAFVFACTEMIRSNAAVFIITLGAAAASLMFLPGSILGPQVTAKPAALAHLLCIALMVILAVAYRASINKVNFSTTSFATHILLLVLISFVGGFFEHDSLRVILYYAAIAYIPLSVGNIFAETTCETFDRMRGKTTQPMALFRSRVVMLCIKVLLPLTAFLLLLPSVDFSFMTKVYASMLFSLVKLLGALSCAPPDNTPIQAVDDPFVAENVGSMDGRIAEIIGYVCIAIMCLCALEVLRRIIVKVVRVLHDYFAVSHERTTREKPVAAGKYDTIEQLERIETRKKREKLTAAQSNAQKVRRIYKKRVEALLKTELGDLSSKAPDEIATLVHEHGYDISELTRIYKKARYSDSCTAQDVVKARTSRAVTL